MLDTDALAEFIASKYGGTGKIVEVMVSRNPWVAKAIKERLPETEVVVVDIGQDKVDYVREVCPELRAVRDDILDPTLDVYNGTGLIYAVRPPEELLPYVYDLAVRVGADVLIRPYSDVDGGFSYPAKDGWRLMSYKRSAFWLLECRR